MVDPVCIGTVSNGSIQMTGYRDIRNPLCIPWPRHINFLTHCALLQQMLYIPCWYCKILFAIRVGLLHGNRVLRMPFISINYNDLFNFYSVNFPNSAVRIVSLITVRAGLPSRVVVVGGSKVLLIDFNHFCCSNGYTRSSTTNCSFLETSTLVIHS